MHCCFCVKNLQGAMLDDTVYQLLHAVQQLQSSPLPLSGCNGLLMARLLRSAPNVCKGVLWRAAEECQGCMQLIPHSLQIPLLPISQRVQDIAHPRAVQADMPQQMPELPS